jgi:hypothetical protein
VQLVIFPAASVALAVVPFQVALARLLSNHPVAFVERAIGPPEYSLTVALPI